MIILQNCHLSLIYNDMSEQRTSGTISLWRMRGPIMLKWQFQISSQIKETPLQRVGWFHVFNVEINMLLQRLGCWLCKRSHAQRWGSPVYHRQNRRQQSQDSGYRSTNDRRSHAQRWGCSPYHRRNQQPERNSSRVITPGASLWNHGTATLERKRTTWRWGVSTSLLEPGDTSKIKFPIRRSKIPRPAVG